MTTQAVLSHVNRCGLAAAICFCLACLQVTAQRPTATQIRGVVLGPAGPLAGALVRIQATGHATSTDRRGRFAIALPASSVDEAALTAWAPGHFCGGPVRARAGLVNVKIRLNAHPQEDNPDYEWLPATSGEKREYGQGCAACHSRPDTPGLPLLPVEQWRLDAHSRSAVNPIFLSMYQGADVEGNRSLPTRWSSNRDYGVFPLLPDPTRPYFGPGYKLDFPNSSGNCGACHVPAAAVHDPYGIDPARIAGTALEGVTCDFCHKIWAVRLDPTTGLPFENMPGVLSFEFRRPPKGHQFFAGPFDDVAPGEDTFSPLMRRSEICAPCHFGVFWGTRIYNSFGEWLASPYSDPGLAGARSCQDCHMVRGGADHFALPERGGRRRDPATVATHLMPGISDATLMRNAASVAVTGSRSGAELVVEVRVTNDRTGHHLPTDSPMRQVFLVVEARAETGDRLVLSEGPMLPEWAGDLEGQPGRAYAKILEDLWTAASPSASYWNPTRVLSDTRLAAFSTDVSRYVFRAPSGGPTIVEAKLLFRRAFQSLAEQKNWKLSDLEMGRTRQMVPAPDGSDPTARSSGWSPSP
jgi:mono/diheme cytochrome c family protein